MQQQVYNTAREQQENSKRYSKRYSKFIRYSLLILFINIIIQGSYIAKDCNAASSLFIYKNSNQNINRHFVAGMSVSAPGKGSPNSPGPFVYMTDDN